MPFLQLCFRSAVIGRSWRIQCHNRSTVSLLGYILDMNVMACLAHDYISRCKAFCIVSVVIWHQAVQSRGKVICFNACVQDMSA